jgi:AraC-like DNA-binding protein
MKPIDYLPSRELAPYIKGYKVIESTHRNTNRVLPEGNVAMAFRYKGSISYMHGAEQEVLGDVVLSGLRKTARLINYEENSAAIVVVFKEGGAAAFFSQPVNEFYGESVGLDLLIEREEFERVREDLREAVDDKERIKVIEVFLMRRMRKGLIRERVKRMEDGLVMAAVEKIKNSGGKLRVKELAASLFVSQDVFEKKFRNVVGATPKQYSSIVRMRRLLLDNDNQKLLELAIEAGFYDQAHFNHEFKVFTGLTPKELFKSSLYW